MHKTLRLTTALMMTALMMTALYSCQSSRMAGGFTYSGSKNAPDMGASGQTIPTMEQKARPATPSPIDAPASYDLDKAVSMVPAEKQEQARAIADAIKEEMARNAQNGKTVTHREALHNVTEKLVKSGQIAPISAQNMKKMDKMAQKMDQKAQKQGPDLDMRNISGLEWFFLIMSGAGLVLGIIGVALGWVVFLVFGGLFLYWKLVQDK